MNELIALFRSGGLVMIALGALAMLLCFLIVERFMATGARARAAAGRADSLRPHLPRTAGLRRMGMIRACIVVAPLLGLLGTVTGMIDTFQGILHGGYLAEVSAGISKALLTTQYGLSIAAPALVAERILVRRLEKLNGRRRAHLGPDLTEDR